MSKKISIIFSLLIVANSVFAQIEKNVYPLNAMDSLLTKDVEDVLDTNLIDKKVVFLGESYHAMGSDFLAKTQFVKYLVLEKGYKDIAFECDFFGLYFDHDKNILNPFWANSSQCKELFEFLKANNVTIWGFDNQVNTRYTVQNFSTKLSGFINDNSIPVSNNFFSLINSFFKDVYKSNKTQLASQLELLLKNEKVNKDLFWCTAIESFKSFVIEMTNLKVEATGAIRDNQMAKNLDFLVKTMPNKKFIVWLHNAHMTKDTYTFVSGQNMGGEFVKLNPNISYHIAFSTINTLFRNAKKIEKDSKDKDNLLHFLPNTTENYFIDAKEIVKETPDYKQKGFDGLFDLTSTKTKTNWFGHYDALVFISKGEFNSNN